MSRDKMDCIVVGGAADGTLLRDVRVDAELIELGQDSHVKPVETPHAAAKVERDTANYRVHVLELENAPQTPKALFGIAVPTDKTLTYAFSQLVIQYVQSSTDRLIKKAMQDINH